MPTNTEKTVNAKLAECLRGKHPVWTVGAEQTGVFVEKLKQPDIVISHENGLTVIVETEYAPARTVRADAKSRLGKKIQRTGEEIEVCLAVRLPASLRQTAQKDLDTAVQTATYSFVLFLYGGEEGALARIEQWPGDGWLEGSLEDLADSIEAVVLSERRVLQGVRILEETVRQAAGYMQAHTPKYIFATLAEKLHQEAGEQTNRMALAILANAVIFHMRLARLHPEIAGLADLQTDTGKFLKGNVLDCWQEILAINYWPIFRLASDLLRILPEREVQIMMKRLAEMAAELDQYGAADIQDLSGRMFQKLITDRKFLATFYTLPTSSTLLAQLAVARLKIDWSIPEQIAHLRVADLACGTGALLGAAYQAMACRHRRRGGDDSVLHAKMMESVLTAADIMPSAVHLTAATLSGMHPNKTFRHTRVINMPYGDQGDDTGISIGSLDLIQADQTRSLFGTGRKALSGKGIVVDNSQDTVIEIPHGSMDLVIMNPPFTRPTNHEKTGVPVPSFAGFRTEEDEQAKMSVRLQKIRKTLTEPAGHGNAGLASNFIDLAHAKLRSGGVLALVLPASFVQGASWKNARALIQRHYTEILIVGLATDGSTDRAFSADTGMAEILLVATRKTSKNEGNREQIVTVNLLSRPKTQLEALITARRVEEKRRETGAAAGRIRFTAGHDAGSFFRSGGWGGFGIREPSLVVFMESLEEGRLLLPRMASAMPVQVCELGQLGRRGFLDRDINGRTRNGEIRGPLDIEALTPSPEYPVLWGHDTWRERQLIVAPDSQGRSREGYRKQAAELWRDGASRLHFNRDFGLASQALAACLTEKPCIGGRAWPNFLTRQQWEIPLVLWANTTIGLISFWWAGTRQQEGRSNLTISRLPQLLSLDARQFTKEQLDQSREMFDDFQGRNFLPANEAYRDEVRMALDRAVLIDFLGLEDPVLDDLAILREQWCNEPGVHGGKTSKPES